MLKTVVGVLVAGVFIWLILKTVAQVLKSRVKEQEMRLRKLELEAAMLEEERRKEDPEVQQEDSSSYNAEMAAKWKREVEKQFQNIRALRGKIEEQNQSIESLKQETEERGKTIKELESQLALLEQETPLAQVLGQLRKTGGVFLRQHPADETRVEAGGIEVVTIMSLEDARRFFGDTILRTLGKATQGEWVEGRLKEAADED